MSCFLGLNKRGEARKRARKYYAKVGTYQRTVETKIRCISVSRFGHGSKRDRVAIAHVRSPC